MGVSKCPNCKAEIGPTGKCEYCGTRVDFNNQSNDISQNSELSFRQTIEKTSEKLQKLRLFPRPSFLENTFKLLLTVITLGIYSILRNRVGIKYSFYGIELDVLNDIKKIKSNYSGDKEVERIIIEFEKEIELIKKEYNSTKAKANLGCAIVFVIVFVLLVKMMNACNSEETISQEDEKVVLIQEIEKDINAQKYNNARILTKQLYLDDSKAYLRIIQLAEAANKLKIIKEMYSEGNVDQAKMDYNNLRWIPIDDPEFDYKETEALNRFNMMKDSLKTILENRTELNKHNNVGSTK